ncbi:hypothetical protein ACWCL1_08165 [Ligilactobacillus sp. LYQ135]
MNIISMVLISISICLLALIVAYGTVVFLIGEFKLTNNILKELFLMSFSEKYQNKIVKEVSDELNKQLKAQLNQIISTKNKELITELGEDVTNEDINIFKDVLKEITSKDSIVTEKYVMKFCKENDLFSFIDNLNEFIKLAPLLNETKYSDDNMISSFMDDKIKPLLALINVNMQDFYRSTFIA